MANPRARESNVPPKHPKSPLFAHLKCPNCRREPVIVFPLIRDHHMAVDDAPLVCMKCCMDARDRL